MAPDALTSYFCNSRAIHDNYALVCMHCSSRHKILLDSLWDGKLMLSIPSLLRYETMAWYSPFIYVPYYFFAIYAFIYEREWIRIPSKFMATVYMVSGMARPSCEGAEYLTAHLEFAFFLHQQYVGSLTLTPPKIQILSLLSSSTCILLLACLAAHLAAC